MTSNRLAIRFMMAAIILACSIPPVFAGGPLLICDPATGTPFAYPAGTTPVFTDPGTMGPLTNAQADALTAAGFAEWSGVTTSTFDAAVTADIAFDVTFANVSTIIGTENGHGGFDIIYDDDGSIISGFFGAPPGVLGIASPDFASGCDINESWAVVNGAAVDPSDAGGASFGGVFTHEFGHAINLAHSQTNGAIVFRGDATGPSGCATPYAGSAGFSDMETMYPFIDPSAGSIGIDMATIEHPDDVASISNVYPAAGWPATLGSITGRVFLSDSITEVTGVNVIARNLDDPFADAISALSGDFTQGTLGADGRYTFNGLAPGASYAIYIDGIVAGGFSTTPFPLSGDREEFFNDSSEGADPDLDERCAVVGIQATSPAAVADIIINSLPPLPPDPNEPNDSVAAATAISCGFTSSEANIDPLGDVDFYTFTLNNAQLVSIDIDASILGSSLDSTLGLFDSVPALITTSDDDPAPGEPDSLDSFINRTLSAGTYFIAVSSFSDFTFDGVDAGSTGIYSLNLECAPPPVVVPNCLSAGILLATAASSRVIFRVG